MSLHVRAWAHRFRALKSTRAPTDSALHRKSSCTQQEPSFERNFASRSLQQSGAYNRNDDMSLL